MTIRKNGVWNALIVMGWTKESQAHSVRWAWFFHLYVGLKETVFNMKIQRTRLPFLSIQMNFGCLSDPTTTQNKTPMVSLSRTETLEIKASTLLDIHFPSYGLTEESLCNLRSVGSIFWKFGERFIISTTSVYFMDPGWGRFLSPGWHSNLVKKSCSF